MAACFYCNRHCLYYIINCSTKFVLYLLHSYFTSLKNDLSLKGANVNWIAQINAVVNTDENVNIAWDWLSHGTPPFRSSRSTLFDRVEFSYPGQTGHEKERAIVFTRLVKKRLSTARLQ